MTTFYVATNGNDAWSGGLAAPARDGSDGPFATLEKARNAIRRLQRTAGLPRGGVKVLLRGGVYPLARSFQLDGRDSGHPSARIVYAAFPNERVRWIGGAVLRNFRPVRDKAIRRRLSPGARDHVLECDLTAYGIRDPGGMTSRGMSRPISPAHPELFFRGRRMTLARWPNAGFVKIAAFARANPAGDGHGGKLGRLEDGFHYAGDRPKRWQSVRDIWVHGYWGWDWANSCEAVRSIDTRRRLIRTRAPYGVYGFRAGQRFFFLNVLEELAAPGEYYIDRATGRLYFWPPGPIGRGETLLSILKEPLLRSRDTSLVTIRGITFEATRGDGIAIEGGSGLRLEGCTIRNTGNRGALVSGGTEHAVVNCHVHHTGDAGIVLGGGDRRSLKPGRHLALRNHIHHMGEWTRSYQAGVLVSGVGQRVAHNHIHDGPHNAILLHGNDHCIEFNHIHHVCAEAGDVGAFYMGRNWTERGNIIRYNLFHHIAGVGMGSMAVYLDDCAGGVRIFGNIFFRCSRAVLIGGGCDNLVENNIFFECNPGVWVDGRGLDPNPAWRTNLQTLKNRLLEMKPSRAPYRRRYPSLLKLVRLSRGDKGVAPLGNRVVRNVFFGGKAFQIHWHATTEMVAIRDNLLDQNPQFVDAAGMDFRLKKTSPAMKLGFRPIPVERIGPVAKVR